MGEDRELAERICDAALACIARWGVSKTTLEDVAREAGCGRATIYRTFHGGKRELLLAVLQREINRFRDTVDAAIGSADPDDLETTVVAGVVAAARYLEGHEALQYLLSHEPDAVLPHVAFHRMGPILDRVAAFAAPYLEAFVADPEDAARAAEWVARVVLSYSLFARSELDLADERAARHLIRTYVLPGLRALTVAEGASQ
ncbi:MAG: TetR/AcrR family transcriptional regulator [Acidimicrobiales bacterium]